MKHLVNVFFNPGFEKEDMTKRVLLELGVGYDFGKLSGLFTVTLEKDDPRLNRLLYEIKAQRLDEKPIIREEKIYTNKELESAELIHITSTYTVGFKYRDKMKLDTSTACPVCKRPAKQKSELVINKLMMGKKDIATTYDFEWVISERLAKILLENGLTGYKLLPVKHYTDKLKKEPVLYQLLATQMLPPLATQTKIGGRKGLYCETCGSGIDVNFQFYYNRYKLNYNDFNKAREHFSNGTQLIISQNAYQVFKQNKIRGLKYEPVVVIDGGLEK
jgi:hypothetical protein